MNQNLFGKASNTLRTAFAFLIPLMWQVNITYGEPLGIQQPTPTPHFNWPVLEKGKVIMVELKSHISVSERERVLKEMSTIGIVKNIGGSSEGWAIKVTNGMSAKSVYELMKADPAVVYDAPVFSKDGEIPFPGPRPTPTHRPYPTPNWDRLVPGKDYVANRIIVGLKPDISEVDSERILELMGSIGNVKHEIFQGLKMEHYVIQITNGMSVKDAIEKMKNDPSVKYAEPDGIYHFN